MVYTILSLICATLGLISIIIGGVIDSDTAMHPRKLNSSKSFMINFLYIGTPIIMILLAVFFHHLSNIK